MGRSGSRWWCPHRKLPDLAGGILRGEQSVSGLGAINRLAGRRTAARRGRRLVEWTVVGEVGDWHQDLTRVQDACKMTKGRRQSQCASVRLTVPPTLRHRPLRSIALVIGRFGACVIKESRADSAALAGIWSNQSNRRWPDASGGRGVQAGGFLSAIFSSFFLSLFLRGIARHFFRGCLALGWFALCLWSRLWSVWGLVGDSDPTCFAVCGRFSSRPTRAPLPRCLVR